MLNFFLNFFFDERQNRMTRSHFTLIILELQLMQLNSWFSLLLRDLTINARLISQKKKSFKPFL